MTSKSNMIKEISELRNKLTSMTFKAVSVDATLHEVINDLKELLKSNRGRSSILNSDIEEIINKYSDDNGNN